MSPEFKPLVEEFQRGAIGRREFIQRVIIAAGGLAAAAPLLNSLGISEAEAAQVDPNDPALESKIVQFPGKAGTVYAYQSRPKTGTNLPAVIVIHADRGVNPHIEDVARRFAREGYIALATDYLSRHGGTAKFSDADKGLNMRDLAPTQAVAEDTDAAATYLKGLSGTRADRIGVIGFCWGGQMAFHVATQVRGLKAVAVFYGRAPQEALLKQIEAPVLAHYGEKDKGVTGTLPETVEAMKRYGKSFTHKVYPNAGHAFYEDTRADRYHPEAAKEAWELTLAFFAQHLKA